MTQNNERELIERLALVDIDLRRSHNGFDFIASLSELEAFAKAYKTASDEKSISQNEQQEAVAYVHPDDLNEMNKIGRCYIFKSSGKGLVPLYTSPPKQAIPDGWRPIETAPHDEAILVAGGDCHYPCVGNWSGHHEDVWRVDGQMDTYSEIGWPTHWMPLDSLPALPLAPTNTEVGE